MSDRGLLIVFQGLLVSEKELSVRKFFQHLTTNLNTQSQ